ncbi:hypothetical protein [Chryseobacterium sp. MFBS3-17]|uniref:hypothetical protein n=1 Tax=Chryseobacterium sp. MFBS3-17 TaxID=2886689 RepID=UPI001D0E4403|nr:hypothetical protein [Chryseobacterium sp. MFBS3-17]MCC2590655.1 hypothetical protein [Chryseobacterium sp. MFBS3-17]
MEFYTYQIQQEDTLEELAGKHGLAVDELLDFHNSRANLTQQIFNNDIPYHIKKLFLPAVDEHAKTKAVNQTSFRNVARYRCEQSNVSRINNEIITLSAHTFSEFLVSQAENAEVYNFEMTDFTFEVDPVVYEKGFLFAQKLEKLKLPLTCRITENGRAEVFNFNETGKKWIAFRDHELQKDEIFQQLLAQAPKQAEDIIVTGNKEFLEKTKFSDNLDKNLFFHIFFRASLGSALQDYELHQFSQLFPNISLNTAVVKSLVKEDDDQATYRLVGTLKRENLSDNELKKRYDEIYKSALKFSYTEFDFIYRITYTVHKESKLLLEGKASIAEKIKNNFEVITEYKIKRVEV